MKSLRHWLGLGIGSALLLTSLQAMAAEQVVLKYRVFRESVSVRDLTEFAQTGNPSPDLQTYLRLSRQNPAAVRRTLVQPIPVNLVLLDRVLNSPAGNVILDRLGQSIQTPRGGAEREALRAALTLSASRDNNISILEILQNYPTQEVVIDGDRIETAFRQLSDLAARLQNPLGGIFR